MRLSSTSRLVLLCVLVAAGLGACGGSSSQAAPARGIVYVALGASDAVGIGAFPLTEGYVYEIERHVQSAPANTILHNLGINGARIEEIIASELPAAIAADPDLVTLWTGSNDIIGGADPVVFGQRLEGLLVQLKAETGAVVFVGDLVDLTEAPRFRNDPDPEVTVARVQAFNHEIREAAESTGCVLVRLSDVTMTDDLFWIDGFHPNEAGHARLALAFWAEIRLWL